MEVMVLKNILKVNDVIAQENKKLFAENKVSVVNILGSPGAGKTSLLEKTLEHIHKQVKVGAIIGDIATTFDADRIKKYDIPTLQIETQGACHLDANMIKMALSNFNLEELELLFIENIGNLVCPSGYQLGETKRTVVLSVSEGDDKPLKYPSTFINTDSLVISKIDLLPYVNFNLKKTYEEVLGINPKIKIFEVSAKENKGFGPWIDWLLGKTKI